MQRLKFPLLVFLMMGIGIIHAQEWAGYMEHTNFKKFHDANEEVFLNGEGKNRVVFMGNSITEAWPYVRPDFFKNNNYIGRGISGQTTPQMLLRFRRDVLDLRPKVVVILAGINDIAQNTGFTPLHIIAENIMTMADLAMQYDMQVILCSVLPAKDFPWRPGLEPVNKVIELNTMIAKYAETNGLMYVDYHSAMKDENNGLKVPEYTTANDLVHPNEAGYIMMESMIKPSIVISLEANKH